MRGYHIRLVALVLWGLVVSPLVSTVAQASYSIQCGKCCICPSCCSSTSDSSESYSTGTYQAPAQSAPREPRRYKQPPKVDKTRLTMLRAYRKGFDHHLAQRWQAAIAAYSKALAYCRASEDCAKIREFLADARAGLYNSLGNRRFARSDWTAAISAYHSALEYCRSSYRAGEICKLVRTNLVAARNNHQLALHRERRMEALLFAQRQATDFQKQNRWDAAVSAWSKARANCDEVETCRNLQRSLTHARAGFANQRGLKALEARQWIDAVADFEEAGRLCEQTNYVIKDCRKSQSNLERARRELEFAKDQPNRDRAISRAQEEIAALLGTLDQSGGQPDGCKAGDVFCFKTDGIAGSDVNDAFDVRALQQARDLTSKEFMEKHGQVMEMLKSAGAGAVGKTIAGTFRKDPRVHAAVELAFKLVEAGRKHIGRQQKLALIREGQEGIVSADRAIVELQRKKKNAFDLFSHIRADQPEFTEEERRALNDIHAIYDYDILILNRTKQEISKRIADLEEEVGRAKAQ